MADGTGKTRGLVNILGVPGILLVIYFGGWMFSIFSCVVIVLCTIEYKKLVEQLGGSISLFLIIIFNLFVLFAYSFLKNPSTAFLFFIISFLLISIFELFRNRPNPLLNISSTIFGVFWLGICLGSMIVIRNVSLDLMFLTFLSVWICDTSAFLFGKKFGKSKILPSISPKKTWVGFLSGYFSVLVLMILMNLYGKWIFSLNDYIFLSLIYGIVSQFGDFFESMIKRNAGVKDTGTLLMGHGGLLDRFDSLAFVCPLVCIYFEIFF